MSSALVARTVGPKAEVEAASANPGGECDRCDPRNTEFTISLLDCRYLAGDRICLSDCTTN
jgi:hypothetical protein